jgi:alkyl hydroperoxide reductase subunit AhpC
MLTVGDGFQFAELGADVVGASIDNEYVHLAWRRSPAATPRRSCARSAPCRPVA